MYPEGNQITPSIKWVEGQTLWVETWIINQVFSLFEEGKHFNA